VTDSVGKAIANARVVTDGVPEVRGDSAGRFLVRSVPSGTRQVEVLALGMSPALATLTSCQATRHCSLFNSVALLRSTSYASPPRPGNGD
jgi:hypothetical protein